MFVDTKLASRLERIEVQLTRAVTEAAIASERAPRAFARDLGGGVASYLRPGSPMNKLIGVGLQAPCEQSQLESIERALHERGEAVRVELCSLASLETAMQLSARGYRLAGFENVLVRPLAQPTLSDERAPIRCVAVDEQRRRVWQQMTVDAAAHSDETGVVVDELSRASLEEAIADMLAVDDVDRYLAFWDDELAGAAGMLIADGVALMGGAATLPAYRRRGVQTALTQTRLDAARRAGADLAVVTTAPGSQSQANVMKHGFALAYSRAILVLES